MKNDDLQNRMSAISAQAGEQNTGAMDEARMLFEQMTAEVKRQTEIEREDARHRSLLVKMLLTLTLISALLGAATGIYGIYNFPDAPLRQRGDIYTGKGGQPRTDADYERFLLWKNALFGAFGSTFLLGFSFAVLDAREKRRRGLSK